MDKRFVGILVAVIAVFAFLLFSGGEDKPQESTFSGDPIQVQQTDKTQGPATAKVVLIEYADFQCPACGAIYPALVQAKQELGDQFLFVYRHFPLTTIHPNAMAAHRAAEAANNQGKFWEMHDALFEQQQNWSQIDNAPSLFETFAQQLGLDMDRYRSDVTSQAVLDVIQRDLDSGAQLGINSTPTLLLNGQKITNPRTSDELLQLIRDAINSSENPI